MTTGNVETDLPKMQTTSVANRNVWWSLQRAVNFMNNFNIYFYNIPTEVKGVNLAGSMNARTRFRPSFRPSFRSTVREFVRPSIRPYIRPYVRPSVRPSVRPFVRPSVRSYPTKCTANKRLDPQAPNWRAYVGWETKFAFQFSSESSTFLSFIFKAKDLNRVHR